MRALDDFHVKHELLRDDGRVRSRRFREGGHEHFNVRIWIDPESPSYSTIDYVDYELHPTYRQPIRTGKSPEDGYAIEIWTWGEFEVGVTVHFKDGSIGSKSYPLVFSPELPEDDQEYIDVGAS